MVGSVVQRGFQANQRITCEDTLVNCITQSFFNSREEVFGNTSAEYFLSKDHIIGFILRLKADPHITELTGTAGLFFVTAVGFNFGLDLFTVSNTCGLKFGFHTKTALQLGDQNIQLHVSATGENHLFGFSVVDKSEGAVFFVELVQAAGNFVVLAFGLRRDGHGVERSRELKSGKFNFVLRIVNSIAGLPVHLADGNDVTAGSVFDFGILFAGHDIQSAKLVGRVGSGVVKRHVGSDIAGHDLNKAVFSKLIGQSLKYETDGGAVGINTFDFIGRGNIVDNGLKKYFRADVGSCATADNGNNGSIFNSSFNAGDDLFFGQFHRIEEFLHQFFGGACSSFHQFSAKVFGFGSVSIGNRDFGSLVTGSGVCSVVNKIDYAGAIRHRGHDRADHAAVFCFQGIENSIEVTMLLVQFGNIEHDRLVCGFQIFPAAFCTNGQTVFCTAQDDTCFDCTDGAEYFTHEILVAGAVQNVDFMIVEVYRSKRGRNGNLSFDLFCIIVTYGVAVIDFSKTVDCTGDIQHALRKTGLATVAVSQQSDVSDFFGFNAHVRFSSPIFLFQN